MKYHTLSPSELETYNIGYMVGNRKMVITDVEWESEQEHRIYRKGYMAGLMDYKRNVSNVSNVHSQDNVSNVDFQTPITSTTPTTPIGNSISISNSNGNIENNYVTETEKEKLAKATPEKKVIDWGEVQNRWERIATKYKLSKISVLTDKRKQQFKARLAEHQIDTKQFFDIVNKALWTSQFLQGYKMELVDGEMVKIENDNKWKASFDFFLQSSSFAKARENKYASPELLIEFEELERQQGGTNAD